VGHKIVTFDEASFRLVPVYKRVWFVKGKRPQGVFFWSNKKINVFGALVNGKKFYHKWHISLNTLTFRSFLSGFIKQLPIGNYVFLLDNASYHKSSTVMKYLKKLGDNIKVEFFPPYSPELNPTESCWRTIRGMVTNSTYFSTMENLQMKIDQFLAGYRFNFNMSNYLCR
jgi:transposase